MRVPKYNSGETNCTPCCSRTPLTLAASSAGVRAGMAEFSISAPDERAYTSTTLGRPVAASDASKPRIKPTTTSTNSTTTDSPASVNALREGRRNKFRTP